MKFFKEFWVSNEDLDKIQKYGELAVVLRNKDESCFSESVINKAVNKIKISYEFDREITIKESDLDRLCDGVAFSIGDISIIKKKLFGGGENE